jgi:hypothetical protein
MIRAFTIPAGAIVQIDQKGKHRSGSGIRLLYLRGAAFPGKTFHPQPVHCHPVKLRLLVAKVPILPGLVFHQQIEGPDFFLPAFHRFR